MLAEFSKLVGTLNRRIPATERGILFNDPTRLHNVKTVSNETTPTKPDSLTRKAITQTRKVYCIRVQ